MTITHAFVKLNKYGRPIRWAIFYDDRKYKLFLPSNGRVTIWADELPEEIHNVIFNMKRSFFWEDAGDCKVYVYEHEQEAQ